MLMFTNRIVQQAQGPAAFTRRFRPATGWLSSAVVQRQGASFSVDQLMADIDDDTAMQSLVPLFGGARPLLLYVHGNNNTPAACFERCARLQEIYDVEVLGFSWPSEGFLSSGDEQPDLPDAADDAGDENATASVKSHNQGLGPIQRKIMRYQQAKLNAQRGVLALARLLRLLASARLYVNRQPISLAAHSLGAHHLQHTLDVPGAQESLGAQHNVALLAPCCRAEGHAAWLQRIRPRGRTYVTFNQEDWVLYGASLADNGDVKLGADPGALASLPQLRYIDFSRGVVGAGGHGYFVRDAGKSMPKRPKRLFGRLFASESDLQGAEAPRKVYVQGCRADGVVCWMSNS